MLRFHDPAIQAEYTQLVAKFDALCAELGDIPDEEGERWMTHIHTKIGPVIDRLAEICQTCPHDYTADTTENAHA